MSNKYIQVIRNAEGSHNFIDDLIKNVSGGKVSSSKDLVSSIRKQSSIQTKRMDKITELSEVNMKLIEETLVELDTTLKIYNVVGFFAATSGILGTILLAMKLRNR